MRDRVVGTCGNCGGRVLNYTVLHMVGPWPPGVCESCGAEEATSGPVLPMKPGSGRQRPITATNTLHNMMSQQEEP